MKNTLVVALIAALPLLAQEAPAHWGANGEMPARPKARPDMHRRMLEKYDTNKDGTLDEQEKAAMKADMHRRMLEKFDTNGDGTLDDEEKKAMKDKKKHGRRGHHHGGRRPHGPRPDAPAPQPAPEV